MSLKAVALALGLEAEDPLLREALTHRNPNGTSYERLEFVGDRVLNLAVAHWLYRAFPADNEGSLSLAHTHLVRGATCAAVAETLGLWPVLAPTTPADVSEAARARLMADAMEAVLAVLYLRKGMETVQAWVEAQWQPHWQSAQNARAKDAKTALQELLQGRQLPLPKYIEVAKDGPDHNATFTVRVESALGHAQAQGPSKAAAGMAAAQTLLSQIESPTHV